MHETTGCERSFEELEATVLSILDLYFEARLREVAQAPRKIGFAVEAYEEARPRLAEAEEELEALRRRTQEIEARTVDVVVGNSKTSELEKQLSELQEERSETWPRRRNPPRGEKRRLKRCSGGRRWPSR